MLQCGDPTGTGLSSPGYVFDDELTGSSTASRNYSLGVGLGRGGRTEVLLGHRRTVAEGAATAPVLVEAARACGVELPIAEAVRDLLAGTAAVDAVVERLLARPLASEVR